MAFWWVNHGKTYQSEIDGGFIWAPQKTKAGYRHETYTNLTKTRPGDQLFSYAGLQIRGVGTVAGTCIEQEIPPESGRAGVVWRHRSGWLVPVEWQMLTRPFSPRDHFSKIRPILPTQNSPLDKNGDGSESCYLASISDSLAKVLLGLVSTEDRLAVTEAAGESQDDREGDAEEKKILDAASIGDTEKKQLIDARKGQGRYRRNVEAVERGCRLTRVTHRSFLIASHIKPWAKSNDAERLDGNNGFLLAPHADRLFDRGWISFQDNGDVFCANDVTARTMRAWGLDPSANVGAFNERQKEYLKYHREHVYKGRTGA
jgi:putative restriction endonuclease